LTGRRRDKAKLKPDTTDFENQLPGTLRSPIFVERAMKTVKGALALILTLSGSASWSQPMGGQDKIGQ
jgi:hypothetical protein